MKRLIATAALALLLLPGCSAAPPVSTVPDQPAQTTPPQTTPPQTGPVQWNEAGREERPGDGTVYLLTSPAHIWATLPDANGAVQWRLSNAGIGGSDVATLTPKLVDGKWVLDWYDPPAQVMRMTLLVEVPASEPDSPKYVHDGGKRWNPVAAGLVRLQGELSGEKTGVVVGNLDASAAVQGAVQAYFELAARGNYQAAWTLLDPRAQQPNPATSLEGRKAAFLKMAPDSPLAEIKSVQMVQGWKFYDCQCQVEQAAEVTLKQQDGQVQTIHAARDAKGDWRLFWSPNGGLQ